MNNPYESPQAPPVSTDSPFDESKSRLASFAWRLPLYGMAGLILINVMLIVSQARMAVARPFSLFGGLAFIGSVFLGFCFSVVALFLATKYQRVATHAISGLILNSIVHW